MMTFRQGLRDFKLPMSSVWLMNDIAEAKGRQELYTRQAPQLLKALRVIADKGTAYVLACCGWVCG
jgi:hypothetical protein